MNIHTHKQTDKDNNNNNNNNNNNKNNNKFETLSLPKSSRTIQMPSHSSF